MDLPWGVTTSSAAAAETLRRNTERRIKRFPIQPRSPPRPLLLFHARRSQGNNNNSLSSTVGTWVVLEYWQLGKTGGGPWSLLRSLGNTDASWRCAWMPSQSVVVVYRAGYTVRSWIGANTELFTVSKFTDSRMPPTWSSWIGWIIAVVDWSNHRCCCWGLSTTGFPGPPSRGWWCCPSSAFLRWLVNVGGLELVVEACPREILVQGKGSANVVGEYRVGFRPCSILTERW